MIEAHIFLIVIGSVLLTDALDGILARHWDVSTLFGSFMDMTADKLLGLSILSILAIMYPIMTIPLCLEVSIAAINVRTAKNSGKMKSSQIGRIKTWALGISIFSLLLTGLSPELIKSLESIKIDSTSINQVIEKIKEGLFLIKNNKEIINKTSVGLAIIPESIVSADYLIKSIKTPTKEDSRKLKIADLIRNKEYIKDIIFDENFYKENKEKPLIDILKNNNNKNEKKLVYKKDIDKI